MTCPSSDCCAKVLLVFCRFWGLATALGLWGVGVAAVFYNHALGFYMVPLAVIISFLETVFLLNYVVEVCVSPRGLCGLLWDKVLLLDDWKKGLLYVVLAVPCFIFPSIVPLAMVPGGMLILTGLLYSLKTYYTRKEAAVDMFIGKKSYDRFDEVTQEDLEDSINNPTNNPTIMSVVDQIEILEV